jgi:PIN domain nuclease of toxin-antitoxin system
VRILLDTHAFLWSYAEPERLSPTARSALADPGNSLVVSAATAWEIATKWQRGRLDVAEPPSMMVRKQIELLDASVLDIRLDHCLHSALLPLVHRDPFDRMLVAQAQVEKLVLLSSDARIRRYAVDVLW